MEIDNNKINLAFDSLPDILKEAIVSLKTFEILKSIRNEYKLTEDQARELGSVTGFIMMGLVKPENFVKDISERLQIDQNKARDIGQRINEQIFRPVASEIKKLHEPKSNVSLGETQNLPPKPQAPIPASPMNQYPFTQTKPSQSAPVPPTPPKKSLDADLLAAMSISKQKPPEAPRPQGKMIGIAQMDKESEHVEIPEPPKSRAGEEISPSQETVMNGDFMPGFSGENLQRNKMQTVPEPPRAPRPPIQSTTPPSEPPITPQGDFTQTGHFSFSKGFIGKEESESDLLKEDILKVIENPGAVRRDLTKDIRDQLKPIRTMEGDKGEAEKEKPLESPIKNPPKQYSQDPYRESLN
jgi:hypothetical protein